MRIELVILLVGGVLAYNVYTDGKLYKMAMSYKKYYTIGGIVLGALVLTWLFRKNPTQATEMLYTTNEYLKYMPVDGGTSKMLSPILDFTLKRGGGGPTGSFGGSSGGGGLGSGVGSVQRQQPVVSVDADGGVRQRFKRSVSESKKRFVAARQNWLCGKCGNLLQATYEIDHVVRLDRGGSNDISNLSALCPSCHRSKTLVENF